MIADLTCFKTHPNTFSYSCLLFYPWLFRQGSIYLLPYIAIDLVQYRHISIYVSSFVFIILVLKLDMYSYIDC